MRILVENLVREAIAAAQAEGVLPAFELPADLGVERPREAAHGDWACSVALRTTKLAKMPPRAIAEVVAARVGASEEIEQVEIAGPGFINVRLSAACWQGVFARVRREGPDFGRGQAGEGTKVNVEFISSNPTGPMHLGHGRWAALGDAICRVLAFAGYEVTREFYINDAGNQMNIFAESVSARYLQLLRLMDGGPAAEGAPAIEGPLSLEDAAAEIFANAPAYREELPENCYAGAYIVDIAATLIREEGAAWAEKPAEERNAYFKERAYAAVLSNVRSVLDGFGLHFDVWFSERTLHATNEAGESMISEAIAALRERGYIYENEGATFFRTTDFGDDKDRVLVKSDGAYTYFAPDIAYHKNKLDRGHARCIDLLGADHHGYIKRIQAVGATLGHPGQPEVVIGQMVNLFRDGKPVRMSKRTGEMVTFEELLAEVGADATRYLMLARSTDQTIDFDIAAAKKQDSSNPVYYVQYAHARICSILRKAAAAAGVEGEEPDALAAALIGAEPNLACLTEEAELDLARKLEAFAEGAAGAARDLAPFRLTHSAEDLAATFHRFYTKCHVLTDDADLTRARLAAADATRRVLAQTLGLIGVSAPERM